MLSRKRLSGFGAIAMRGFMISLSVLCLCAGPLRAQTSYPMITHTTPVAVQRGTTTEVTVEGQMDFAAVYKALFSGDGITAEVLAAPPAKATGKPALVRSVKLKLTVAADAAPGTRDFRLASS